MNLRVMHGALAVDQDVDGVAGMRAVDLCDVDPLGRPCMGPPPL